VKIDIDAATEQPKFKELKDEKLLKMSINEIESYIQVTLKMTSALANFSSARRVHRIASSLNS
jgi:hypothetical protein